MIFLVINQKPSYRCIFLLFPNFPVTNLYFIPQKFWQPYFSHRHQITQLFNFFRLSTPSPLIHHYSSLQKQPFITAYFHSSLHILCITAR